MVNVDKFELHYYLKDGSHSIDAFVRHKCEQELLAITKDILTAFGGDISILSEIPAEGGFRDFWRILKKHKEEIQSAGTIITAIVLVITAIISNIPKSNPELENLQQHNLELDNEKKLLEIQKLKNELEKDASDKPSAETIKKVLDYFDHQYKTVKHKSNFYQTLQSYSDVVKISTTTYTDDKVTTTNEVDRRDFHKFILTKNELTPKTDDHAIIEIISPVLRNQQYKWKGLYNGELIHFSMRDIDYKNSIIKGDTIFHSGFFIECVLYIKRKVNDLGMVENYDYSVTTVLGKIVDQKIIETEQGKKYKRNKRANDNQGRLDL